MTDTSPLTTPSELEDTSDRHAQHEGRGFSEETLFPERSSLSERSNLSERPPIPKRPVIHERRLVIALDYGTTHTGVAFATPLGNEFSFDEIDVIGDWGLRMSNLHKVPSVISYSSASDAKEEQWGRDLSPDAVAMIHTKLELDVDDVSEELDFILQALDGMKNLHFQNFIRAGELPDYTDRSSEEIVTDYLEKVVERVLAYLLKSTTVEFSEKLLEQVSTDIVITVPTDWTYRAKNSTYRALTKAGFNEIKFPKLNDVILVTEPEAAAIYTARHLKDVMGQDFLKPSECFVLCDAGGGTVDVVSYRVKRLSPSLELERIGLPTGEKCGSIFIDLAFKAWLKDFLGEKHYRILDPIADFKKISTHTVEGEHIRELMKRFNLVKENFKQDNKDIPLDLPGPLENLDLDNRVRGGEITIPYAVMQEFFENCVNKIVKLILGHVEQIRKQGARTKNIFLVGGFAESEYLQNSIEYSLRLRKINLRRPNTSLTAVVRGAVICGIEKSTTKNLGKASACRRNYAISVDQRFSDIDHDKRYRAAHPQTNQMVATGQLIWLFSKGDLILSDEPKVVQQAITTTFNELGERKGSLRIYSYDDDDRPERIQDSTNELAVAKVVQLDLSDIDLDEFEKRPSRDGPSHYYVAHLALVMTLDGENLEATVKFKDSVIVGAANIMY